MKKIFLPVFLVVSYLSTFAQILQSPEQFLGYKIGTKFTPHYKIVQYFNAVATARPDMVKVEKYGQTYEGRDLIIAYIASPDHFKSLESIREHNLALTGTTGKVASQTSTDPAIVWLSYNVHGNEPSSSEAAMLTLFSLIDPSNATTKQYLENTVVIIDPCMNPDGRDRYVNWFKSVVGKNMNADPQSREHKEPWPGGRTNHYNFDLNRDWAWQTQVESQQRMVKYNQWLPQVHVDFHEQGYNNPYYFAPAAEPFHEVITPWQREFQNVIGKNNAKYFDEKGWLFFTRESFDLFYPSYGDTYPLYSGAIGMTYEQAGHSRGGLAVITAGGDTLTLVDRVAHHYTTGLSTIETASKNAAKLVSEFKKFYDDSRAGKGNDVKTYVLTSDNVGNMNAVIKLLDKNGIIYEGLNTTGFKGFHYTTGKEENGQVKKYSLAVSTSQARSVLARVLLEPVSNLPDSNTYDITAWSLPYVYGVDAYAVKQALPLKPFTPFETNSSLDLSNYGYLIRYNSFNSARLLAQLLKYGVKVRYAEKGFRYNNKQYEPGTLIILERGNRSNVASILNQLAEEIKSVEIESVSTGFMEKGPDFGSPDIKMLKAPRVALLTGEQVSPGAAGEVWHLFDQQLDYPISLINAADLSRTSLKDYNVLIIPDGFYKSIAEKTVADRLKEFVKGGGSLVAMEGAVQQMASGDWDIKIKEDNQEDKDEYAPLKKYESRDRDQLVNSIPGAIYKVQLDNTHPLAFGYPSTYYTLKQDPAAYEFLKGGWNVGVIKKDNYVSGFVGAQVKTKLKDALVFGVKEMGNGNVIYMVDDPLFRQFWENGKLLFANAVFLVGK